MKPPAPILTRLERATSDYDVAAKRSNKPWSEEQYKAAGVQLLHLRLRPEHHGPLDELCAQWGLTRGEAVKRAIDEAHARHVAPYAARRGAEQAPDESTVRTPEQQAEFYRQVSASANLAGGDLSGANLAGADLRPKGRKK